MELGHEFDGFNTNSHGMELHGTADSTDVDLYRMYIRSQYSMSSAPTHTWTTSD